MIIISNLMEFKLKGSGKERSNVATDNSGSGSRGWNTMLSVMIIPIEKFPVNQKLKCKTNFAEKETRFAKRKFAF